MGRVNLKDLAVFSRQLSTMQAAGLPVATAISIIAGQTENLVFRAILERICGDLKGGSSFAGALAKHPFVFPELFVNLAKAGETGGNLDAILDRLSAHFEQQIIFKKKIRHEVVHPVILGVVSSAAGLGLLLATVRAHLGVISAPGRTLPWSVGALISAYNFLHALAQGAVFAMIAIAVLALLASFIPPLARLVYEAMVLFPYYGAIWKKAMLAKFARLMATLQRSGVPILDSMEITARLVGHGKVEKAIMKARANVREGEGISGPLKNTGMFPHLVIQMVSAGEETGKLDDMFVKIADYYDAEVEAALLPARLPGILAVAGIALLVHGLILYFIVSPILSAIYLK